jgi:hypothetical protein
MIDIIKKALPKATVVAGKTKGDVIVKSKDREKAKAELEKYFTTKKVKFTSVFKKSKSGSLEVLSVLNMGDVIFKPVIQKGAGGLKFEKELEIDLNNYFNGADSKDFIYPVVVSEIESVLKLTPDAGYEVIAEGKKNQKRQLTFNGKKLTVSNSSGRTLTDLTLAKGNKKIYLSLKMSETYYTLNASIFEFFKDKTTQVAMNQYFGFDGQKMGGFGSEYACITSAPKYSNVKNNLADILDQAVGHDVVIVHKKTSTDVMVKKVTTNSVTVSDLDDTSYRYPEAGVRKYANIKCNAKINKYDYEVNFQFRGTTPTDVGPKYLRILLERL